GAVGARYEQAVLAALAAEEGERFAIGGPHRSGSRVFFTANARGVLGSQVHEPKLAVGAAGPVGHGDGVGKAAAIGRERNRANGAEAREISAEQALTAYRPTASSADEDQQGKKRKDAAQRHVSSFAWKN